MRRTTSNERTAVLKRILGNTAHCRRIVGALGVFLLMGVASLAAAVNPIEDALNTADRLAGDKARDASRRPAEVLAFFGVKPGMRVLDLFSGGGYYTEIMARAVGETGWVVAHNNDAYLAFSRATLQTRYAKGRLGNVRRQVSEGDDLVLPNDYFDFVMMALTYHDLYFVGDNWPAIDAERLLREVYESLRPGGIVGIIDHVAPAGTGYEAAQRLHRIDPALIEGGMRTIGFDLDGTSDVLVNPDDPLDIPMFDPAIRGKTHRTVMRFRKP